MATRRSSLQRSRADASSSGEEAESDGEAAQVSDGAYEASSALPAEAAPTARWRGTRVPLTPLTAGVESRKGTAETVPDYYKPSLGAQLMAAFRRMCGQGDPYFLSRHQVASSTSSAGRTGRTGDSRTCATWRR